MREFYGFWVWLWEINVLELLAILLTRQEVSVTEEPPMV